MTERRLEVLPLAEEHLTDAARLLAARHAAHRRDEPLLPPAYEDPAVAERAVREAFGLEHASGAVAVRDGRVVGYLLGAPKPSATWGENVWVESAGLAVERAEDARDLYAAAAADWVAAGRTAHYVLVPAHDGDLVAAWFRLAFGHQHTHAVRPLGPQPARLPPGLRVRRAEHGDIPVLARLELELPAHQATAPTFSSAPASSYEESVAEWEEDWDDPDYATFVAEHQGRVVGSAVGCPLSKSSPNSGLLRPPDAGFLGFAAVFPGARGLGAGRALGEAVAGWCTEQDFSCVATDWRETNLLSSRAWPALGYRPTFVRLHRLLGH